MRPDRDFITEKEPPKWVCRGVCENQVSLHECSTQSLQLSVTIAIFTEPWYVGMILICQR